VRALDGTLGALAAEAASKSSVVWLSLPALSTPRAVWHVWHNGAIHLVGGGAEQPLPGLTDLRTVDVTLRSKETGQRLLVAPATVTVLTPDSAGYDEAVSALAAARLNATGGDVAAQWHESSVVRLDLTGPVTEHPGAYLPDSHAAAPAPTAAGTAPLRPFTLHRRVTRRRPLT
jgi:hypothetical protein